MRQANASPSLHEDVKLVTLTLGYPLVRRCDQSRSASLALFFSSSSVSNVMSWEIGCNRECVTWDVTWSVTFSVTRYHQFQWLAVTKNPGEALKLSKVYTVW